MTPTLSTPLLILMSLEVIVMIGLPIAAILLLRRRWGLPLSLALAGAATFILSQVLHIPATAYIFGSLFPLQFYPLIVQAIALGLSAGLFEEIARYLVYRFWRKEARSWREGVFFGLGHGGVEAILTGLLVAVTLINVVIVTTAEDPAALGIPESALQQVEEFWALPLYMPLLAVAERIMALILHMSLSTLVLLSVVGDGTRRRPPLWPLFAAILWHAFGNAVAVYVHQSWGPIAVEGALFVIALLSIGILWLTYQKLPVKPEVAEAGVE